MRIAPIVVEEKRIGWMFFCPACKHGHAIQTASEYGIFPGGDIWTFNGDTERPTIKASVLSRCNTWIPPVNETNLEEFHKNPWKQEQVESICHSMVTDGRIEFMNDCTHDLKNKTVELPEI